MLVLENLRYALRTLRRTPGFTAAAVLTLALGIGANTAIFSVVNAALLRPLPFPDADRLVRVYAESRGARWTVSPPDFMDWRRDNRVFEGMAAIDNSSVALAGEGEPENVPGARVTSGFFRVLGVAPALGHGFTAETETPGRDRVVVLSDGVWRRRFGADPGVLGRTIQLDGRSYVVVGVMPAGFAYPQDAELWTPLAFSAEDLTTQRGAHYLDVIARLKSGVRVEQAETEMRTIARRLSVQYPKSNYEIGATVGTLRDALVGDVRPALLILLGAVGLVLLIACANVANLVLARAAGRQRELAVRTVLGAQRAHLIREVMTESVVVAVGGGLAGLLLAAWTTGALSALRPAALAHLGAIGLDGTVLAFTLGLSLLTGLLFGLAPALYASRAEDLRGALQDGGRGVVGAREGGRLRSALVAAELALAVMLLVGAGLLLKSFARLRAVDPGLDPHGVLTFSLALPDARYPKPEQAEALYAGLLDRIAALPGVRSTGAIFGLPFTGFSYGISAHSLDGRVLDDREQDRLSTQIRIVTPDYFRTMGIPLVRGRGIAATDRADAPPVVVVNESAARLLWGDANPLGHHLTVGTTFGMGRGRVGGEVVGVVRDSKHASLAADVRPTIFLAHAKVPVTFMSVVARVSTAADPMTLAAPIREQLRALDPQLPMYDVRTMEQLVDASVAQQRFSMLLLAAFAAVAVALAAVGIAGVVTYVVSRRTHEIGIRVALGASPRQVVGGTVAWAMRPALLGVGLGLGGALALTRTLTRLLYGVPPTDPATFAAVAATLGGVALLAAYLPARRAARIDPMEALRNE